MPDIESYRPQAQALIARLQKEPLAWRRSPTSEGIPWVLATGDRFARILWKGERIIECLPSSVDRTCSDLMSSLRYDAEELPNRLQAERERMRTFSLVPIPKERRAEIEAKTNPDRYGDLMQTQTVTVWWGAVGLGYRHFGPISRKENPEEWKRQRDELAALLPTLLSYRMKF